MCMVLRKSDTATTAGEKSAGSGTSESVHGRLVEEESTTSPDDSRKIDGRGAVNSYPTPQPDNAGDVLFAESTNNAGGMRPVQGCPERQQHPCPLALGLRAGNLHKGYPTGLSTTHRRKLWQTQPWPRRGGRASARARKAGSDGK